MTEGRDGARLQKEVTLNNISKLPRFQQRKKQTLNAHCNKKHAASRVLMALPLCDITHEAMFYYTNIK